MTPLRFAYHPDSVPEVPFLIADGAVPADAVRVPFRTLSHWPGSGSPARFRAETTTEMALLLAADPDRAAFLDGIEIVTNNHFDLDGVLSTWCVLRPGEALRRRPALVAAARAGDFEEWTTRPGVALELALEACEEGAVSPAGDDLSVLAPAERESALYDAFHDLLPELLDEEWPLATLGEERLRRALEAFDAVRAGALDVREHPGALLTVHEIDRPIERRVRWAHAAYPRVLTFERRGSGIVAGLEFQQWTWFDTPREGRALRRDLGPLAARLQEEERGGGVWKADGPDALTPRLRCEPPAGGAEVPTSIDPRRIEAVVLAALSP